MTSHLRAAVWLDHHEARVFHVDLDSFDESAVRSPRAHLHRHPKGTTEGHDHPDDAKRFFHEVAKALSDAGQILVLGPSTAKLQFITYVHEHDKTLAPKIVGVESVDHPTDAQLVAYVKKYFHEATPRLG
jgi:stalled ribosome rescue protein Dom34